MHDEKSALNRHRFVASDEEHEIGERLDKFLTAVFPDNMSRSYLQHLIKDGHVLVNGVARKANYVMREDDAVDVSVPEPLAYDVKPENIPLDIVYEDDDMCVVNKAAGMVVHPAYGHAQGTLVHALLYHCRTLSGINGVLRPGIVHRLDKDTSGLMVVAKNDQAHKNLAEQLAKRTMTKIYAAICCGVFAQPEREVITNIGRSRTDRKLMAVLSDGGKEAISIFRPVEHFAHFTLMDVELKTGRTHQIRVHLKHLGHPLLGDDVYNRKKITRLGNVALPVVRQALHARELRMSHPRTQKELCFQVPLPEDMQVLLSVLRQYDHIAK